MTISQGADFSEVDGNSYVSAVKSVTNTQLAANVSGSNLSGRQALILFNQSSVTVYFGPTGVTTSTGIPLFPNQMAQLSFGDGLTVYLIAATAGPHSVIVQETA